MDVLIDWPGQHKAASLLLIALALLVTAALSAYWIRQALIDRVTWLDAWIRPHRSSTPALYWMAIAGQVTMAIGLFIAGLCLLVWGIVLALA